MKLSLIIPIYSGPDDVRAAVASVAAQTRRPDQLVLVDDCGPDDAFDVAVETAQVAGLPLEIVRQPENRGVSAARNAGLRAVSGEVVGFLDGDDVLDPEFCEVLLSALTANDAQIAVCRTQAVGEIMETVHQRRVVSGHEYARLLLEDHEKGYVCNKLFRRQLLPADPFPVGRLYEDFQVTLRAALVADRVAIEERALYHYLIGEQSITQRYGPHLADLFQQAADVTELLAGRPGFERAQLIHRVGGIVVPVANMSLRASSDPQWRELSAELLARARSYLRPTDPIMLGRYGKPRLAIIAAMLNWIPTLYGRALRTR